MKRFWFLAPVLLLAACTTTDGITPGFTLSVSPQTLTVAQGASGQLTISVTRKNGFVGAVTLEFTNPPTGVSSNTLTVPEGAASGVMTINVNRSATIQTSNVIVKGTSGNLSSQVSFALEVTPGSNSSSSDMLINDALELGLIDYETALSYKVFSVFGDERLPEAYRGDDYGLSGTSIMRELVAAFDSLSPAVQATLQPFLLTPAEPGSWYELIAEPSVDLGTTSIQWGTIKTKVANAKVWWDQGRYPEDAAKAQLLADELDRIIWPKLTGVMNREPLPDCGAKCPRGGGDERVDIYLAYPRYGARHGYAMPMPVDPKKPFPRPYFIVVDRAGKTDRKMTLAHELMHTIQGAYPRLGEYPEYEWLSDATAVWAENFVYPDNNDEHQFAMHFLKMPTLPLYTLGGSDGRHQYGAYLFFFYLQHQLGRTDFVRKVWESVGESDDSLWIVDTIIPGGFEERFPEFVLLNANQLPVDNYTKWDKMPWRAEAYDVEVKHIGDLPLDTFVFPLASRHYQFTIPNDAIRLVSFTNPLAGGDESGVKLQALVKIKGHERIVEDWTEREQIRFCRDEDDEDLEELLLIISYSDWSDPDAALDAGALELSASEECFAIDRIEGPDSIKLDGAPGEFDVFWKGKPTFPVQMTVVNLACELGNCAGGTLAYDEEKNPLGFTYRCFTVGGGDKPPPTGTIVSEITLSDSAGLTTPPIMHTITCQQ
jgi:hypothetical protein